MCYRRELEWNRRAGHWDTSTAHLGHSGPLGVCRGSAFFLQLQCESESLQQSGLCGECLHQHLPPSSRLVHYNSVCLSFSVQCNSCYSSWDDLLAFRAKPMIRTNLNLQCKKNNNKVVNFCIPITVAFIQYKHGHAVAKWLHLKGFICNMRVAWFSSALGTRQREAFDHTGTGSRTTRPAGRQSTYAAWQRTVPAAGDLKDQPCPLTTHAHTRTKTRKTRSTIGSLLLCLRVALSVC